MRKLTKKLILAQVVVGLLIGPSDVGGTGKGGLSFLGCDYDDILSEYKGEQLEAISDLYSVVTCRQKGTNQIRVLDIVKTTDPKKTINRDGPKFLETPRKTFYDREEQIDRIHVLIDFLKQGKVSVVGLEDRTKDELLRTLQAEKAELEGGGSSVSSHIASTLSGLDWAVDHYENENRVPIKKIGRNGMEEDSGYFAVYVGDRIVDIVDRDNKAARKKLASGTISFQAGATSGGASGGARPNMASIFAGLAGGPKKTKKLGIETRSHYSHADNLAEDLRDALDQIIEGPAAHDVATKALLTIMKDQVYPFPIKAHKDLEFLGGGKAKLPEDIAFYVKKDDLKKDIFDVYFRGSRSDIQASDNIMMVGVKHGGEVFFFAKTNLPKDLTKRKAVRDGSIRKEGDALPLTALELMKLTKTLAISPIFKGSIDKNQIDNVTFLTHNHEFPTSPTKGRSLLDSNDAYYWNHQIFQAIKDPFSYTNESLIGFQIDHSPDVEAAPRDVYFVNDNGSVEAHDDFFERHGHEVFVTALPFMVPFDGHRDKIYHDLIGLMESFSIPLDQFPLLLQQRMRGPLQTLIGSARLGGSLTAAVGAVSSQGEEEINKKYDEEVDHIVQSGVRGDLRAYQLDQASQKRRMDISLLNNPLIAATKWLVKLYKQAKDEMMLATHDKEDITIFKEKLKEIYQSLFDASTASKYPDLALPIQTPELVEIARTQQPVQYYGLMLDNLDESIKTEIGNVLSGRFGGLGKIVPDSRASYLRDGTWSQGKPQEEYLKKLFGVGISDVQSSFVALLTSKEVQDIMFDNKAINNSLYEDSILRILVDDVFNKAANGYKSFLQSKQGGSQKKTATGEVSSNDLQHVFLQMAHDFYQPFYHVLQQAVVNARLSSPSYSYTEQEIGFDSQYPQIILSTPEENELFQEEILTLAKQSNKEDVSSFQKTPLRILFSVLHSLNRPDFQMEFEEFVEEKDSHGVVNKVKKRKKKMRPNNKNLSDAIMQFPFVDQEIKSFMEEERKNGDYSESSRNVAIIQTLLQKEQESLSEQDQASMFSAKTKVLENLSISFKKLLHYQDLYRKPALAASAIHHAETFLKDYLMEDLLRNVPNQGAEQKYLDLFIESLLKRISAAYQLTKVLKLEGHEIIQIMTHKRRLNDEAELRDGVDQVIDKRGVLDEAELRDSTTMSISRISWIGELPGFNKAAKTKILENLKGSSALPDSPKKFAALLVEYQKALIADKAHGTNQAETILRDHLIPALLVGTEFEQSDTQEKQHAKQALEVQISSKIAERLENISRISWIGEFPPEFNPTAKAKILETLKHSHEKFAGMVSNYQGSLIEDKVRGTTHAETILRDHIIPALLVGTEFEQSDTQEKQHAKHALEVQISSKIAERFISGKKKNEDKFMSDSNNGFTLAMWFPDFWLKNINPTIIDRHMPTLASASKIAPFVRLLNEETIKRGLNISSSTHDLELMSAKTRLDGFLKTVRGREAFKKDQILYFLKKIHENSRMLAIAYVSIREITDQLLFSYDDIRGHIDSNFPTSDKNLTSEQSQQLKQYWDSINCNNFRDLVIAEGIISATMFHNDKNEMKNAFDLVMQSQNEIFDKLLLPFNGGNVVNHVVPVQGSGTSPLAAAGGGLVSQYASNLLQKKQQQGGATTPTTAAGLRSRKSSGVNNSLNQKLLVQQIVSVLGVNSNSTTSSIQVAAGSVIIPIDEGQFASKTTAGNITFKKKIHPLTKKVETPEVMEIWLNGTQRLSLGDCDTIGKVHEFIKLLQPFIEEIGIATADLGLEKQDIEHRLNTYKHYSDQDPEILSTYDKKIVRKQQEIDTHESQRVFCQQMLEHFEAVPLILQYIEQRREFYNNPDQRLPTRDALMKILSSSSLFHAYDLVFPSIKRYNFLQHQLENVDLVFADISQSFSQTFDRHLDWSLISKTRFINGELSKLLELKNHPFEVGTWKVDKSISFNTLMNQITLKFMYKIAHEMTQQESVRHSLPRMLDMMRGLNIRGTLDTRGRNNRTLILQTNSGASTSAIQMANVDGAMALIGSATDVITVIK